MKRVEGHGKKQLLSQALHTCTLQAMESWMGFGNKTRKVVGLVLRTQIGETTVGYM